MRVDEEKTTMPITSFNFHVYAELTSALLNVTLAIRQYYSRTGFDCEYLLVIANCDFFLRLQLIVHNNSIWYRVNHRGFAIRSDLPKTQWLSL